MERLEKVLNEVVDGVDFKEVNSLINDGIFDSFEIINTIAAIEKEFEIEIPPEEITLENFDTIQQIWNMIQRLKK